MTYMLNVSLLFSTLTILIKTLVVFVLALNSAVCSLGVKSSMIKNINNFNFKVTILVYQGSIHNEYHQIQQLMVGVCKESVVLHTMQLNKHPRHIYG